MEKLRNLRMSANHYVKYRRLNYQFRLNVITVVGLPDSEPQIEHIKDFAW